ncbi:NAD(P)/FAD-dependent oxidoreductase [Aggregatibacter actinomycetemcomitans]|uniref:NAD(P)/FAD-dependent oxidoreductase n=1 Tax=Aggregatibacter actinomycetemcomitans TaxID=714 RepID=UPI00197BA092|nr:NAD(P)/FAD-dependent oxidoreductase [Aggregatibacter actinomycetemcomitans]MBN6080225.1 NAD(P)/FAD-dependent oxidoreductase [Aggregatibacter actinomycetemcomitans]
MSRSVSHETLIIGAGAAGLFCAAQLAKRGGNVRILDNGKKVGRKILMSGGGFCNFTNMEMSSGRYLSQNPHFVKSALKRFTQWDFIGLVADYGIAYHEKEPGQLFCDNGAEDIVNMLLAECKKYGVEIALRQNISAVEKTENGFCVTTNGETLPCRNLVVATGGLSMPGLGATPFGYQLAQQFGINVIAPRASLVPFTWRECDKFYAALSGISLDVAATNQHQTFTHQMLFTHRGLSGPAILQISNYWQPGESIHLDLLPYQDIRYYLDELRQSSPKLQLKTALIRLLPKKLVELWLERGLLQDEVLAQLSKVRLENLVNLTHNWQFVPNGTEGYRTAEVTMGGVDTHEISSKTMESNKVSGLYFIGEVLDVAGWLGGYNFQWAWSSAYACAQAIAEKA